eukprot:5141018-Alexandrium_andersonii.AAC.1
MCRRRPSARAFPSPTISRSASSSSAPLDSCPLRLASRLFRVAARAMTKAPTQPALPWASLRPRLRPTCECGARALPKASRAA